MPQTKPIAKIHAAATYFAFVSRNPHQIALAFHLKEVRTLHRWADMPEWDEALDACNYTGDRCFQNVPGDLREDGTSVFELAHQAYCQAVEKGIPANRRAAVVASEIPEITSRKVRDWARKYKWG